MKSAVISAMVAYVKRLFGKDENLEKRSYPLIINQKISVIMPVYLGAFPNAATGRDWKFLRAVRSFLKQCYTDKELIIVSDGCELTNQLYAKHFEWEPNVLLVKIDKQPNFSGNARQAGLDAASGDTICYLDSDDCFSHKSHLSAIMMGFCSDLEWVYYNDQLAMQDNFGNPTTPRMVEIRHGSIGTSSIAHRRMPHASWRNCNGYGHDWMFITKLIKNQGAMPKKIHGTSYLVCHVPNILDV